jgi:hypothetical protein
MGVGNLGPGRYSDPRRLAWRSAHTIQHRRPAIGIRDHHRRICIRQAGACGRDRVEKSADILLETGLKIVNGRAARKLVYPIATTR